MLFRRVSFIRRKNHWKFPCKRIQKPVLVKRKEHSLAKKRERKEHYM
jgi:hypothetical protein